MIIRAKGHANITAMHDKTVEFTKDSDIGKKADCILGVDADFNADNLNFLKQKIKIEISISAGGISDKIAAYGSPDLNFKNPKGLIIRRSNIITDKTIALFADKTAKDIKRELINKLKNSSQEILIEIKKTGSYDKLDFFEGLRFID